MRNMFKGNIPREINNRIKNSMNQIHLKETQWTKAKKWRESKLKVFVDRGRGLHIAASSEEGY